MGWTELPWTRDRSPRGMDCGPLLVLPRPASRFASLRARPTPRQWISQGWKKQASKHLVMFLRPKAVYRWQPKRFLKRRDYTFSPGPPGPIRGGRKDFVVECPCFLLVPYSARGAVHLGSGDARPPGPRDEHGDLLARPRGVLDRRGHLGGGAGPGVGEVYIIPGGSLKSPN